MNDMASYDPSILETAGALLELNVVSISACSDGVLSLTLNAADGSMLPLWEAGAHIDVILPNGLTRQYSLCGNPDNRTYWQIGILNEPASRGGSRYIHENLRIGDRLQVSAPRNNFSLVEAKHYLFIAGGIGITPILPMLRKATQLGKSWTLLYGGRTHNSMAFLDEIAELSAAAHAQSLIRPQDEFGLLDLAEFLKTPCDETAIYCCGPGPLIDAVESNCAAWHPDALHRERFTPKEKPALEKGAFEVELARSGKRLIVPPFRSLLSVLQEAGCKVTNSCTAGICGTCLVKVISGTPQHNDDVLSDRDRASGEVMLVCVSRSESDLLVLDL